MPDHLTAVDDISGVKARDNSVIRLGLHNETLIQLVRILFDADVR